MEPVLEKVLHSEKNAFSLKEEVLPHIIIPLHFHPEYELTLIAESHGKRFIGDHLDSFNPGDLLLIGPDLPHFYKNDEVYYQGNPELNVRAIVVHFLEDGFGKGFFDLTEMSSIKKLLEKSKQGMKIVGETQKRVALEMEKMVALRGFERAICLVKILHSISLSEDYQLLSSRSFKNNCMPEDVKRINKVYEFLLTNFKQEIQITEVANLVNMNISSFCRFLKKSSGKTFSQILNELRIGHACKLLLENDVTISEACYASGYNNISYFNRKFKSINKLSPLQYRKSYFN